MSKRRKNSDHYVGPWEALRDFLIVLVNKGVFLFAMPGLIVTIVVLKMPAQDVSKAVTDILNTFVLRSISGYILSVLLLALWYIDTKSLRRRMHAEMDRMGREKTALQGRLLNQPMESSES